MQASLAKNPASGSISGIRVNNDWAGLAKGLNKFPKTPLSLVIFFIFSFTWQNHRTMKNLFEIRQLLKDDEILKPFGRRFLWFFVASPGSYLSGYPCCWSCSRRPIDSWSTIEGPRSWTWQFRRTASEYSSSNRRCSVVCSESPTARFGCILSLKFRNLS